MGEDEPDEDEDETENKLTTAKRYLILETNYRLYAYTDSALKVDTLKYFAKLLYKLPNMAVLTITRETIQGACERGITAEMIISYIRTHAHDVQKNSKVPGLGGTGAKHILPPVVTDSIRIWALERDRTRPESGIIYYEFDNDRQFMALLNKAIELDIIMYYSKEKKQIIIKNDDSGHKALKKVYKEFKKQHS